MLIYGYAIEYRPKDSGIWYRYWNHKIYSDERIANESKSNIEKDVDWIICRIIPLYSLPIGINPQQH